MNHSTYVLMTAARNERRHMDHLINSVRAQTLRPLCWVIVSDGSTDGTDELIKQRLAEEPYIRYVRIEPERRQPGFAGKVCALECAGAILDQMDWDYIGNLDADVMFDANYYEQLVQRLDAHPAIGIAGGYVHEWRSGRFRDRPCNRDDYVAGAVQMFRCACFRDVGGYERLRYGGEDTVAMMKASMRGWVVRAYPDLVVRHMQHGSIKRGVVRDLFREGAMRQALGSHPAYELAKCARRAMTAPYVIGGVIRWCGYVWPLISGQHRVVDHEFVHQFRHQQMAKLKHFVFSSAF